MIGHITGRVHSLESDHAIVDVSGVGYKVYLEEKTRAKAKSGEKVSLWVHTAVRETALDLFGFKKKEELDFFELLLGISGIGPRSALSIMSVAPTETLVPAIASGDTSYLVKVSGIGAKTANKIVLELKDKVVAIEGSEESAGRAGEAEAMDALTALGYSKHEAREALKDTDKSISDTSQKVREALKILGS